MKKKDKIKIKSQKKKKKNVKNNPYLMKKFLIYLFI